MLNTNLIVYGFVIPVYPSLKSFSLKVNGLNNKQKEDGISMEKYPSLRLLEGLNSSNTKEVSKMKAQGEERIRV